MARRLEIGPPGPVWAKNLHGNDGPPPPPPVRLQTDPLIAGWAEDVQRRGGWVTRTPQRLESARSRVMEAASASEQLSADAATSEAAAASIRLRVAKYNLERAVEAQRQHKIDFHDLRAEPQPLNLRKAISAAQRFDHELHQERQPFISLEGAAAAYKPDAQVARLR